MKCHYIFKNCINPQFLNMTVAVFLNDCENNKYTVKGPYSVKDIDMHLVHAYNELPRH